MGQLRIARPQGASYSEDLHRVLWVMEIIDDLIHINRYAYSHDQILIQIHPRALCVCVCVSTCMRALITGFPERVPPHGPPRGNEGLHTHMRAHTHTQTHCVVVYACVC